MSATLTPVTTDRLARLLTEQGYHFRYDEDGDLVGMWEGNLFYFLIPQSSDMLQVMSYFRATFDSSDEEQLQDFIDEWHRTKYWPRLTLLPGEDENGQVLQLRADHAVHYEHGATDEQLRLQINCALQVTLRCYGMLAEEFGVEPFQEEQ